ncbi:hypothetical protein FGG08_001701 [Glutinoglossum americanum]|uniref:Uncharacterized protein n=1 Tax=Glutinoglossum americanum TaxID=1670608 RepID=A0A9P8L541_9PEZI|nr:hypothetical protein FGG08_001701 [Glutinoglossum americanum]
MLLSQAPLTQLSLLTILLASTHRTAATPFNREALENEEDSTILVDRDCPIPCGWQGQLCCAANQRCYTDGAGQAQCGAIADAQTVTSAQGIWQVYTTTIVETDLVTRISIYSSYVVVAPAPTASAAGGVCDYANYEQPCGSVCCPVGQVCQVLGTCVPSGAGSSQFYSSYFNTYSVPLRPTSGGATIVTSIYAPTATVPYQTPIGTAGGIVYPPLPSNSGLSGGAIAGIALKAFCQSSASDQGELPRPLSRNIITIAGGEVGLDDLQDGSRKDHQEQVVGVPLLLVWLHWLFSLDSGGGTVPLMAQRAVTTPTQQPLMTLVKVSDDPRSIF